MLNFITDVADPLLDLVRDDPVRPEIPRDFRVSDNRFVAVLSEEQPRAMVCVSLHDFVPQDVEDLSVKSETLTTAVFYTIWSYSSGAASELLFQTVEQIRRLYPTVTRFVTLSPKTDMARRFHLRNGAVELQENITTVNYEYRNV